jgi:hypothetical protein
MSADEIRRQTQKVWNSFYSFEKIWRRSNFIRKLRWRMAFLLISKLYCHMYAKTGIATDAARRAVAIRWARAIARPCQWLFAAKPLPELQLVPRGGKGSFPDPWPAAADASMKSQTPDIQECVNGVSD